jgi:hypothetical protein
VSKDSLRQMTVALVNANSHENPSWQEEWVYRTGLSLNDFIPGHEDLMKDLYDERQPARNFLLLQALIAGTCSEYSQALLSSFKRRLIDLKKPHTREELEKIIHDLDDIRNLMLCTGGSDKHYFYSDILAIINQIKSVLPVLENSTTDADALIRNLFSDPAITQLQQYAAEQQIIEPVAQQPKCVSLLSWLLFFRRSDEG